MCNCNKGRRSMLAASGNAGTTGSRRPSAQVAVKLIGPGPVNITGGVTGKIYSFRKTKDVNMVDRRDAVLMKSDAALSVLE
jgi:hypothetical protein